MNIDNKCATGSLAAEFCNKRLPLEVLQSQAGFYIGTSDECMPFSRESVEYFKTRENADGALKSGEWTQRDTP